MKSPVILIGIGEMGSVFARGLLRSGHPVYPVRRDDDMHAIAQRLPAPELVLVAVAENDLHAVLEAMPVAWQGRLCLLQNELRGPGYPGQLQNSVLTEPALYQTRRAPTAIGMAATRSRLRRRR